MIVTEKDISDKGSLKYKVCNVCNKEFKTGQSYEKITTHRKSKLIIHTGCIGKGR
jgi:hypothetical protein